MVKNILHALDIGEYKIRCFSAIGDIGDNNSFEILGFSETENSSMINGSITDLDLFKKLVKTTIIDCEMESSVNIDELIVGIGGSEVKSIYTNKKAQIHESSQKVSQYDIDELLRFAIQSELPRTSSIINNYFLNFQIDDKNGIINPLNQIGKELYANMHLLSIDKIFRDTITEVISEIGKSVSTFVTEHEASYYSMNNPDEKIFATVDVGFKNTNITIYDNKRMMFSSNIELGGFYFTSDVSHVTNISKKEGARIIDELSARLNSDEPLNSATISVVTLSEKKIKVPFDIALQIIEARMNEIAKKVVEEITKSGYYKSEGNEKVLEDGIVLIGGSANLTNFKEIFMSQMDIKTQIGKVDNIQDFDSLINKPQYNIILGLFNAGIDKLKEKKRNGNIIKGSGSKISIYQYIINIINKIF